MLLLEWMHVHFFPLVHPAVLIFRAGAYCGLKYSSGIHPCRVDMCFMNSCTSELMGAMEWETSEFF